MRSSVLDSPDIGKRAAEISAERLRNIVACQCRRPDGGGEVDRSACPLHRDPPMYEGCCLAPCPAPPPIAMPRKSDLERVRELLDRKLREPVP